MIDHPRAPRQQQRGRVDPAPPPPSADPRAAGDEPRSSEFGVLEPPPPPSSARLARLESERAAASSYVPPGTDAYWDLRDKVARLEGDVRTAVEAGMIF